MRRALVLATLLAVPMLLSGQATSILRVTVTLPDDAQKPTPISRYVLLVSDNPATTVPRRVLTGPDGTLSIPLIPGSYTIESDRPATFAGKAYEWTQMIDVVAGQSVTLALTADNADVVTVTGPASPAGIDTSDSAPLFQADKWLGSVVAIWSPTSRATGFLIDAKGLIATRGLAAAKGATVAVQVSGELKVAARVLLSDPARDVAIVWVHPTVVAGRTPVPLGCQGGPAAVAGRDEITALTAPFGRLPEVESGEVTGATPFAIEVDLRLGFGGAGGPIFNDAGQVVGLTSLSADKDRRRLEEVTVVRAGTLCEVVAAAQPLSAGTPPEPIKLPIEPTRRDPAGEIENGASTGTKTPPVASSSDFDVAIITPLLIQQARQNDRTGGRSGRSPEAEARIGRLTEFGAWSEYFADLPAVVIVRVTPKMVEGFWKRLGREAARTQGAQLPPFKDFKTSFVRMRASCGDAEVVPIQPFVLEHRTSDTRLVREGLYVFDPAAFGPACGRVTLSIYSEKSPEKADTVTIDASLIRG